MKQVYFDMDGVLADFDQGVINTMGRPYDDDMKKDFWKRDCVEKQIFLNMPEIKAGLDLLFDVEQMGLDICIMTSTGGAPNHHAIARQKLSWLESRGLEKYPVAFCTGTASKGRFAQPGALLIDDRGKVCAEWERQGGTSFLFTPRSAGYIAFMLATAL